MAGTNLRSKEKRKGIDDVLSGAGLHPSVFMGEGSGGIHRIKIVKRFGRVGKLL